MSDDEHRGLAQVLNSVQGMAAISNYQCELMDELYPAPKWKKSIASAKTIHYTKGKHIEALWTNYDPVKQSKYMLRLLERRHGLRITYLDAYQAFVLAEPDSAVSQPLKEAFLALRQAAEADE